MGEKGETGKSVAREEGVCILEGGVVILRGGKVRARGVDGGESESRLAIKSANDGSIVVFLGLFPLGQGTFEVL